jgi:hypothetical protein
VKLAGLLVLAGGIMTAPMLAVPASAAPPSSCDGLDCVPNVARDAAEGAACAQGTRFVFGVDASGRTYICSSRSQWVPAKPLIGIRPLGAPCAQTDTGYAQSPDGTPLACRGSWVANYSEIFYSKTYY